MKLSGRPPIKFYGHENSPPLKIKSLLESNPLKSKLLIGGLGVSASGASTIDNGSKTRTRISHSSRVIVIVMVIVIVTVIVIVIVLVILVNHLYDEVKVHQLKVHAHHNFKQFRNR